MSHKVYVSNIKYVINASEAILRKCSILGVFWGIIGESKGAGAHMPKCKFNKDA